MKRISQLSLLFLLLLPFLAGADDRPISQLKAFLAASKTLSADFKQVSFDKQGKPAETSFGVFYLKRPGQFRWDYQKPFEQQIVSDAGRVWFYDVDLEQVTIKKIDQSIGATPALLLSGEIDLEDNFTLLSQGLDVGMQWIRLQPKSEESSFKYILIGMEHGLIGGMELSDNFGQLTRIYFSNIKTNGEIDSKTFKFVIPEGVDVFAE